jgi:ATP-dependent Clp protease ATP-binding subunit ClpB
VEYIAAEGYDPEFGARPVKRAIQNLLLNVLSTKILGMEIDRSREIVVDAGEEGLTFTN